MPRRKNWKIGKARKDVLRKTVVKTDGCNLPDGGLANPIPSSVSDERTSGALVSDLVLPDGGVAHPQKPSGALVSDSLPDGGVAHPLKPSGARNARPTIPAIHKIDLNELNAKAFHDKNEYYKDNLHTNTILDTASHQDSPPLRKYNKQEELIREKTSYRSNSKSGNVILSMVFGSFHQGHERFSMESRGNQCCANALCSLIYAQFSHLSTTHDVDNVLVDGDILYKKIIQGLKEKGEYRNMLLNFDELPAHITILNKNVIVEKYDVISGICVQQFDDNDLPSLQLALELALQKSDCLLLIIGSVCSAVFKNDGKYYLFDSHCHGQDGLSSSDGSSILISFQCLDNLVTFMYALYDSMHIAITSQFDLLPVKLTTAHTSLAHKNENKMENVVQAENVNEKDSSVLLESYFLDQSRKLQCKRKHSNEHNLDKNERKLKRNEYMKIYMKKKRQDPEKQKAERLISKLSKQKARQMTGRQEIEREMSLKCKQKSRLSSANRETERIITKISKQKARQSSDRQEKERSMSLKCKQKSRLSSAKRETDRMMTKVSMQKARQSADRQEKERSMSLKCKQKSRLSFANRETERIMTKISMQKARQSGDRQEKERSMTKISMQKARQSADRQEKERRMSLKCKQKSRLSSANKETERLMTKISMQKARQSAERPEIERNMSLKCKQKSRQQLARQVTERFRTLKSMRRKRVNKIYQEVERIKKQIKRRSIAYSEQEKKRNTNKRQYKRSQPEVQEKERSKRHNSKYGSDIVTCIKKFSSAVSKGPVYVCTCCHQTWFRHSVVLKDNVKHTIPSQMLGNLLTGYISVDNSEWICNTCLENMKQNKVPPLSVLNKNAFPLKPKELELHQLEERLVSLRIPFMQIRELPRGGQLSIKGNVVNVPVDIQPVIKSLPRTFDMNCTIPVKLKKKLTYKSCDFTENVRPLHVISALHWLFKHSELYRESGVSVDDKWLESITSDCSETVKEFFGLSVDNSDKREVEDDDSDHFSEIDESENIVGNSDTLLDAADASNDSTYTFAPGEGQTPISLYQDKDAEYLSFPTIFCGQKRAANNERHVQVHFSDMCKLELRHIDRRVASNVPNIFFKLKKVQIKQVSDKVNLALRRCKTEGKKFTASQMLNSSCLDNMVRLDEGYYIFRSLRNSPPYFEARKKDVFAMIRQLGLPTWFMSLSSADTRWHDLLNILSQINNGCTLSSEDIDAMTWVDKTKLVQKDPVTCVRYFDHRVQEFINTVLRSSHEPLGKIQDFFYRVEFQQRGSPHIHMLVWIQNAPQYKNHSMEQVISFIDKYVSCQRNNDEQLVNLQVHKHSKSCRKKEKAVCRFGYPIPPMKATTVLEPLNDNTSNKKQLKDLFIKIQKCLDDVKDTDISYDDFLSMVGVTEAEYVKALQSSLNGPKVFLKRDVNESRVNAYMKPILEAWRANHDLQFVLDPYACAVYIVSYISKAQRGMSILMSEACKEAKRGNMDLRQQVRHIGNKFLNSVEVSAQEACYLLLQMPLTKATRDVVFINTSIPTQRTFLLKSRENLEKLPSGSTDIEADNIIKRYSRRPKALENWCLADYVSQLDIKYKDTSSTESADLNTQSNSCPGISDPSNEDEIPDCEAIDQENFTNNFRKNLIPGGKIVLKNGIEIKERKQKRVIRYVRFSKKVDKENFFRERLLLFTSWRNEETDLKQDFESYQSRYMSIRSFVENKANEYEKNAEELDKALERAQDEENFDDVAPSNEQAEDDDASVGARDSESFVYFDPDRPESQRQTDIAVDVGTNVASVHINLCRKTMPDSKYRELINSLNVKQREFFVHVVQTVKLNKDKLCVFLSGGAGVGKSVLVAALFEKLQRYLTSDPGDNPENCKILLCAPTGKAAFHIKGVTLHSAFRIPASQGYKCTALNNDTLNTIRTKYKDLAVVMIDEVSMVGNSMLRLINERLQQIKGSSLPFGGLHIIFIGDLFQLKPVMDGWIFENLKRDFGPLATNLWQELVVMHELDEIMRQRDDKQFAEILNRLREGNQTPNDIEVLKSRGTGTQSTNYPHKAVHLFNTNKSVSEFNVKSYFYANSEKVNIPSLDYVIGDDTHAVKQKLISKLPDDPTHTAGLSSSVGIAVGMTYDLCLNLDVDDGLVNGSTCVVTKIEKKQKEITRPSIIWVSFSDGEIGSEWRCKYRNLYHRGIDKSWTPIFDCKRSFLYLRKTFIRIQIPLRQSLAKTVHKSQGDTLDAVVIDMSGTRVFSHAHYVAVSRSKTLQGLHILNLNESKISVSEKVVEEMLRLRENKLKLCYTPVYMIKSSHFTCLFQNIQSLRSHQMEFFSDPNVQAADILCVVETWLTRADSIESVEHTGYNVFRADGLQTGHTVPHRGIVAYVRDHIHVLHSYSVTRKDIEMMVISILFHEKEILIASLYKSPKLPVTDLKSFLTENLYDESQGKHFILQGDFNINMLEKSMCIESFFQDIFGCNQLVQKQTHSSGSLIDHIYSNIESLSTDVIECVWSDHSLIYAAIPKSGFL